MNIIALRSGVVHALVSKRTACKVRIRENWQPTEAELTCPACIVRVFGAPVIEIIPAHAAPVETPVPIKQLTTDQLLDMLGVRIINTSYLIEVAPGATVNVPASHLRAWCERRLESRRQHANKALKYCSGPGANSGLPTRATMV